MARRRRGRDLSGWVVVDKPAGIGSTDVVTRLRRATGARKAGHAGTLDPAATGVLPVAFGEATKTIPFVAEGWKTYRFTARWGAETTTDDAAGEVVETAPSRPDEAAIRAALDAFRGDIAQVPPRVSAVRVDGARAYDLAREGAEMALAPRPLRVERLELIACDGPDRAAFEMTCGKGGYVRSVARDLGRTLGCLGHVATLRRLATGPFDEVHAIPLDDALAGPEVALRPLQAALSALPEARCDDAAAARLAHGNPAPVAACAAPLGTTAWVSHDGRPVAVGALRDGFFHPTRVFRT